MLKVLFITVDFYSYIKSIACAIEKELNAEVDTLILNSSSSVFDGALNTITKGKYLKQKEKKQQAVWFEKHYSKNYDYIFASSEEACKGFAQAFGYPLDYLRVFPLPRVDLILDPKNQKNVKKKIFDKYKELKHKNLISLY